MKILFHLTFQKVQNFRNEIKLISYNRILQKLSADKLWKR